MVSLIRVSPTPGLKAPLLKSEKSELSLHSNFGSDANSANRKTPIGNLRFSENSSKEMSIDNTQIAVIQQIVLKNRLS